MTKSKTENFIILSKMVRTEQKIMIRIYMNTADKGG